MRLFRLLMLAATALVANTALAADGANAPRKPRRPGVDAAAQPPAPAAPVADFQAALTRFFSAPGVVDEAALARIDVPIDEERRLGDAAFASYRRVLAGQNIRLVDKGKDVAYLRRLVAVVQPMMTHAARYAKITVYLAQSPRCDARSFPGGTLVFFRGLLDTAPSEAAVVGIIGHELAHLDRQHHLRRIRLARQFQQSTPHGAGFSFEQFAAAFGAMSQLWMAPFRPEDEAQADADGATWAYRAGYDPRQLASLLETVGRQRGTDNLPWPDFLRSHPRWQDRAERIRKLYDDLQEAQPKPEKDLLVGRVREGKPENRKTGKGGRP